MKSFLSVIAASLIFAASASAANVTVSGLNCPYLSGMPNGSTASGGDVAPAQSPLLVTDVPLVAGSALTFTASGAVAHNPSLATVGPDGGVVTNHDVGGENGIAGASLPFDALVGVFLDPTQPSLLAAPAAYTAAINAASFSPGLRQVFFIGDGLTGTGTGTQQTVFVPTGATRLYLGTWDSAGWANNRGTFSVSVVPEPALGLTAAAGVIFLRRSRVPRFVRKPW